MSQPRAHLLAATAAAGALAAALCAPAAAAPPTPQSLVPPAGRMLVLPSPCTGGSCAALPPGTSESQHTRVVYLNFEGATLTSSATEDDAVHDVSAIISQAGIPPGDTFPYPAFDPSKLTSTQGMSRSQIIDAVVQRIENLYAPYDVQFVTQRPAGGVYSMIIFGSDCKSAAGTTCVGMGLLDCGDNDAANVVFVFPPGVRVVDLATTAAQELAHGYGLGHTDDTSDVMYPYIQQTPPDHFGAGAIPDGTGCGGVTYQDSNKKLLDTIGPRGQDKTPPTVTITSPPDGTTIPPGTKIVAAAADASSVVRADLTVDDKTVATLHASPWKFTLPRSTSPGAHKIGVTAYDPSNNAGTAAIQVTVAGQPIGGALGDPCMVGNDCLSGLCATIGGESRCTQTCDAADPCPSGFVCKGAQACWPSSGGGGGCSCSVPAGRGSRRGPVGLFLVAAALAALLAARHRRRVSGSG